MPSGESKRNASLARVGMVIGGTELLQFLGATKQRLALYKCRCFCGAEFDSTYRSLERSKTKSCGCAVRARMSEVMSKHGYAKRNAFNPPEYEVWKAMRQRCNNKNNKAFGWYGAKGIVVCARWNDFAVFLHDMGQRPSAKHDIDRIDSSGNYEPQNCRWLTRKENSSRSASARWLRLKAE